MNLQDTITDFIAENGGSLRLAGILEYEWGKTIHIKKRRTWKAARSQWSKAEISYLMFKMNQGLTLDKISKDINRTESAIHEKLRRLKQG